MSTQSVPGAQAAPGSVAIWRFIFAGLCASLVGIGLARFAYTPLLPSLIEAQWFAATDVVFLGAANLAGYLVGALAGRPLARRLSNRAVLRAMMLLVTLAFAACAFPVSEAWFFVWRLASGIAGGSIMVLVAATVLPHVQAARKGTASGAVFLGLGLGIAGSGTLVPLLLGLGLHDTWLGLALFSALLSAASWFCWPDSGAAGSDAGARALLPPLPTDTPRIVLLLYVEYGLMALGLVPAMVFLVDFVVRGLGAGAHLGALFWILYGVGAIAGPPPYGFLADRFGPTPSMRAVMLVQALAVAALALSTNLVAVGLLTVVIGSFPPGIVPLMLARVHQTLPERHARQHAMWSRATTVFAASQALCGYAYSAIFGLSGGRHALLFAIGAAALAIGFMVDCAIWRSPAAGGKRQGGAGR
ncbi:MAG: YbfB/YjiJ family MFS transporter [Burkholderia sp.]